VQELREKSLQVENLYQQVSQTFSRFQQQSGLRCLDNCGQCCLKPDIEATVLEMLPLALSWFDRGIAEEKLEWLKTQDAAGCPLYERLNDSGTQGRCSEYDKRGMICRMFGAAARRDKSGQPQLSVCRLIKQQRIATWQLVDKNPTLKSQAPQMPTWRMQLKHIDWRLDETFYPIGEALVKALELVLRYAWYGNTENAKAV